MKETYVLQKQAVFLLESGVFLMIESLEGPRSPGSLPGLASTCSNHFSRSFHFIFVLHSSTIYESLKYA